MNELTPWGIKIKKWIDRLGKDEAWVCKIISLGGWNYKVSELRDLMTDPNPSRPRQVRVEWVLNEEEKRQKLKKRIGLK